MKKAVILANGQAPAKREFTYLARAGYDNLICADGGANMAFKLGLIPDIIIGDFDSVDKEILEFYKPYSTIIRLKRQNDTDVEKCLKYCIKNKINEVILTGGTGDRLDHSFCNLGIVLKFYNDLKIKIIHQKSILSAHSGLVELETVKGEIISLYGFDQKTKITSKGLKYPLNGVPLPFGVKESTSNIASGSKVALNVKGGRIFIVRDYNCVRDNGFLELY
jgi:thiamine pyrophosphokinase